MTTKLPHPRFAEWLYENGYDYIYEEYYALYSDDTRSWMYEHPLIGWIKKEYPKIWEEYEKQD